MGLYAFNDDKSKADVDALITQLKAACWGWLD